MANVLLDIDHLLTGVRFKPTAVQVLGDIPELHDEVG
jgi:hypothetical protein